MAVQMQARSSSDGQIYTWVAASPDYAAVGFPGPGSALDVVVAQDASAAGPPGADGPTGPAGSDLNFPPILVASTTNIALTGLYTLQGVALQDGDWVGAFGQTDGTQGGVYVAHAGAWTRHPDMDSSAELIAGMGGIVLQGTYNNGDWALKTESATLGTTPLDFIVNPHINSADPAHAGKVLGFTGSAAAPTKVSDSHITDDTIAPAKLAKGVGNDGKFLGQSGGLIGWFAAALAVTTALGVAHPARAQMQFFGLDALDDGTKITIQRPRKDPRIAVRVIRTTNIADFDRVPQVANGHTLQRGHMFWPAGQTNPAENGIYYVYATLGSGVVQAVKLAGLDALATSAEGGLLVWVRGGDTLANTHRRVTNFAAASASAASFSQPMMDVDFYDADIEDYATLAELATAEASQNWEPAFARIHDATRDGPGQIRVGRRQNNYRSTTRWKIKSGVTIMGTGGGYNGGSSLVFHECGGIKAYFPPTQLREYVTTLDTSGGATSGLAAINGYTPVDGDRILRVTTARTTSLTASYVQPAVGATVTVEVASSAGQTIGTNIHVLGAGDYEVTAIPDGTHITLELLVEFPLVGETGDTIASGTYLGGDVNDGLWVAHAGAWTRPTDYDTSPEIDPGIRTKVRFGTHANTWYDQHTHEPITLGTTPLLWRLATGNVDEFDSNPGIWRMSGVRVAMTGTPADLDDACGITTETPAVLDHTHCTGFSGHGVLMDAGVGRIPPSGSNRNVSYNLRCTNNGLCGIRFQGPDANANTFVGASCTSNGARSVAGEDWGVKDKSWLAGNNFFGLSTSTNGGGVEANESNQRSVFDGCYAEQDNFVDVTPPNVNVNSRWQLRPGSVSTTIPGIDGETSGISLSSPVIRSKDTGAGVRTRLGLFGTDEVMRFNTDAGGDNSGYQFEWSSSGGDGSSNCWNFQHAGVSGRRCFGLTGPSHARSHSQPHARLGLCIGGAAGIEWKTHAVGTSADLPANSSLDTGSGSRWAGVYRTGDLVFNAGYTVGSCLPLAWRCTNAGSLASGALTWTPIYADSDYINELVTQAAAITDTTMLTAPPAGSVIEVHWTLMCTALDAGATATQLDVKYTDLVGPVTQSSTPLVMTTTGRVSGIFTCKVASGNLQFAVPWVTPGTTARFALSLRAKRTG
jgi:hypothetical protein